MRWLGKIVGGILGYLITRSPIGALIGVALGHQFDRGAEQSAGQRGTTRRRTGGQRAYAAAERQQLFFQITFNVLGFLAKADGRVSEQEIESARALMRDMRLTEASVQSAIACFTAGKQPGFPIDEAVLTLQQACRDQPELLRIFLEVQIGFLVANGGVTGPRQQALLRVAEVLGVGRMELAHLESIVRARGAFRSFASAPDGADSLSQAYRVLGVEPSATDQQVKTAYRRLMNQYHPDKQAARGLPDSMLDAAKERSREINAAWDAIRAARGIA